MQTNTLSLHLYWCNTKVVKYYRWLNLVVNLRKLFVNYFKRTFVSVSNQKVDFNSIFYNRRTCYPTSTKDTFLDDEIMRKSTQTNVSYVAHENGICDQDHANDENRCFCLLWASRYFLNGVLSSRLPSRHVARGYNVIDSTRRGTNLGRTSCQKWLILSHEAPILAVRAIRND